MSDEQQPQQDPAEGTPDDGQGDSSEEITKDDLDSGAEGEVGDDALPEDLQPTSDNPLARHPRQTGDEEDMIGAAGDEERAKNPSADMGYGSAGGGSDEGSESDSDGGSDDSSEE